MDADLQDPPELLPEMVALYQRGYDVVSAQRIARDGEPLLRRWSISLFYRLIRRMSADCIVPEVGDFRLYSRGAVEALRSLREQHRFVRGLVGWLGLREVILPFHRRPRAAGKTKYPFLRLVRFAWVAVSSFSAAPLRLSLLAGTLLTLAGFCYLGYVLVAKLVHGVVPTGWASIVALQVVFSGTILLAIGLVGDYVARIYEESKGRPLYVVTRTINLDPAAAEHLPRVVVLPEHARPQHVAVDATTTTRRLDG
jgi:dolichol-phosphate mannosyltransferase